VPRLEEPIRIRPVAADELEAVLALWDRARSAAARTRDSAGRLQPLLRSPDSVLLVAVADETVVGTLIVGWDGWRGSMYRLAVAPGERRRGIARRLVEAGHEHLAGLGARRVGALVGSEDGTAAALWRAVGYELDPGVGRYVRDL
jgi:ribosomal protein S18 acetylase RimI-like enzyme